MQNRDTDRGARIAGILTFAAGLLFFLDFLVIGAILRSNPHLRDYQIVAFARTSLWFVISLGLASAPFGLLRLRVLGSGWKRVLAILGTILVCLGAISYVVGLVFVFNNPTLGTRQIFTPLGSVLLTTGMLIIFVSVFVARVWRGWRMFAVMLVWVYFPLQFPLQALLFLGENRGPNPYFLGSWGLCWALLGFAIWTASAEPVVEPVYETLLNA